MHPQTGQEKGLSLDSSVSLNDASGKPQGEHNLHLEYFLCGIIFILCYLLEN